MRIERSRLPVGVLAVVVALAVGVASRGLAANGPFVTTSVKLPLGGNLGFPPGPCVPTGEVVALSGEVHVVTQMTVTGTSLTGDIYLNMAGLSGEDASGTMFIGTGSNKFLQVTQPPRPPDRLITATFTVDRTDGCASVPLPVNFFLTFGSDGTLDATQSGASIGIIPLP